MQKRIDYPILPVHKRRTLVDRRNPKSPLNRYVGNYAAVRQIADIAFGALSRSDRAVPGMGIALVGPASSGKTMLAKLLAEILELPLIATDKNQFRNSKELFEQISKTCEEYDIPLIPLENTSGKLIYCIPPCIVFIDEVHSLSRDCQNQLLKAVEPTDREMSTNEIRADCKNILWIVATTEVGKLFGPFETRFVRIELNLYDKKEIAEIVKIRNPNFHDDVCKEIAQYQTLPRQALAFANQAILAAHRRGLDVLNAVKILAKEKGIGKDGLTTKDVKLLNALINSPGGLKKSLLLAEINVGEEEFDKEIAPKLLIGAGKQGPLVAVTNRYKITPEGIEAVESRRKE